MALCAITFTSVKFKLELLCENFLPLLCTFKIHFLWYDFQAVVACPTLFILIFISGNIDSVCDLRRGLVDRAVYTESFIKSWKELGLDVVLCPVFSMPAPTKGATMKLTSELYKSKKILNYTTWYIKSNDILN